jgi:hypothetical protein
LLVVRAPKVTGPEHLAMLRPGCESAIRGQADQATRVLRRRRCSIIASTPATSERALPPVAGSISGTAEATGLARRKPLSELFPYNGANVNLSEDDK